MAKVKMDSGFRRNDERRKGQISPPSLRAPGRARGNPESLKRWVKPLWIAWSGPLLAMTKKGKAPPYSAPSRPQSRDLMAKTE